jgi:hypothetical protein
MVYMISMVTPCKKFFVVSMNVMLSAIILLGTLVIPVHAAGVTTVKVDPLSQTISSGNTFTISLACVPGQTIKSYELKVVFNPSLLKANSVSEGNIFKSYSTFFNPGSIDNVNGTITNIYDLILGTGITSSSGTLVTISFTAKSTSGTSSINLKNVGITNNSGYIPITITNGSIQITAQSQPSNKPPVYESISPANRSSNIQISTTSLKLTIRDPEGKSFNYTIQTRPNIGSVSVNNAGNGTKSCAISDLKYTTTYRWYVNVTDGHTWIRLWYTFTTQSPINPPPVLGTPSPANGSTNLPPSFTFSIPINDPNGDLISWTIHCSNGQTKTRSGQTSGTKSMTLIGLSYGTAYTVWVNATDPTGSSQYTRRWYTFTTQQTSSNQPPVLGTPSPANGSTNRPLSFTFSIPINDPNGNLFSWTIQCSNGQTKTRTGQTGGTYSMTLVGLTSARTYRVWVNATDLTSSGQYTRRWYTYTTR